MDQGIAFLDVAGGVLPAGGLLDPFLMLFLFDHRQQRFQELTRVSGNAEVDEYVLIDLARVDVDLDLLRSPAELLRIQSDTVAEAGADGNDQVGGIDSLVGGDGAVHAQHAQISGIVISYKSCGHQCICRRDIRLLHESEEQFACAGCGNASSAVDDRTLRRVDHGSDLADFIFAEFRQGIQRERLGWFVIHGHVWRGHILGDIDQDGTLAAAVGDTERIADRGSKIFDPVDEVGVLGDRDRDPCDADLLEGVSADQGIRNIAGDCDHGNAVHECGGDAGDEIRGAGTARCKDDAGLAGSAGVSVRRVGGALLMRSQDVADPVSVFIQCVIQVQDSPSGIAKDRVDIMFQQDFRNQLGSGNSHIINTSRKCAGTGPVRLDYGYYYIRFPDKSNRKFSFFVNIYKEFAKNLFVKNEFQRLTKIIG